MAEQKPTVQPKRPRSDQDQKIADRIRAAYETITIAQTDPELAPLLAAQGYDTVKLSEGLKLQQVAQDAFVARQKAMSEQRQALAVLAGAAAQARQTYADFREGARSLFRDSATRTELGLTGAVPEDLQKFSTLALTGYKGALDSPDHLKVLTQYGYPQALLQDALKQLDQLAAANNTGKAAQTAATHATKLRDQAMANLDDWLRQFRGLAKVATRSRPDLYKTLGF
jgi:hypothetical protein